MRLTIVMAVSMLGGLLRCQGGMPGTLCRCERQRVMGGGQGIGARARPAVMATTAMTLMRLARAVLECDRSQIKGASSSIIAGTAALCRTRLRRFWPDSADSAAVMHSLYANDG